MHTCSGFLISRADLNAFLGNVAGRTKKTIISSATFLGYCVGNMCGSQIFKSKDAPKYTSGTVSQARSAS